MSTKGTDLCDQKLAEIKQEVVACQRCSLSQTRKYPVIGEGNHKADIIFIGEAPGRQEDASGRPFCGAAGNILSEILEAIGLKREDVYIANILKCRPPNNRNPLAGEIDACVSYLDRQIEIIQPKILCPMGNFATHYLIKKYGLVDQVRKDGKLPGITILKGHIFEAKKPDGQILKIIPLYHPAVVTYNSNLKPVLIRDYQIVVDTVA
jgi:uracil-DNA glycosylase